MKSTIIRRLSDLYFNPLKIYISGGIWKKNKKVHIIRQVFSLIFICV